MLALPVVALPIAGKTFRDLCLGDAPASIGLGVLLFLVVPLSLTTWLALRFATEPRQAQSAERYLKAALLMSTWLYFGLNFAFFRFPWPWEPATGRTPSAIVFMICAVGLTWGLRDSKERRGEKTVGPPDHGTTGPPDHETTGP
jgi:hypothetical protein